MIVTMIKSPRDNGKTKVEHLYTGPQDTEVVEGMIECDSEVSALCYDRTDLNIAIFSASFVKSLRKIGIRLNGKLQKCNSRARPYSQKTRVAAVFYSIHRTLLEHRSTHQSLQTYTVAERQGLKIHVLLVMVVRVQVFYRIQINDLLDSFLSDVTDWKTFCIP